MAPGTNCADAPITVSGHNSWLLNHLGGQFKLLIINQDVAHCVEQGGVKADILKLGTDFEDPEGLVCQRYDGEQGAVYLIRPDQHVAARWRKFDEAKIKAAIAKACCQH